MKLILATVLVLLVSTTAFAQGGASPASLKGLDAKEALAIANAWKGNGVTSFLTPTAVNFQFPNGQEVAVPLPEDLMVVSVAPYVTFTHPCRTHFTSGCQGELVEVPVSVLVTAEDGTVIIDDVMTILPNGFIDLWLPRNQELTLHLSALDLEAHGEVSTFLDSNTCVTTFQLLEAGSGVH